MDGEADREAFRDVATRKRRSKVPQAPSSPCYAGGLAPPRGRPLKYRLRKTPPVLAPRNFLNSVACQRVGNRYNSLVAFFGGSVVPGDTKPGHERRRRIFFPRAH
jgi:hypothetical protein